MLHNDRRLKTAAKTSLASRRCIVGCKTMASGPRKSLRDRVRAVFRSKRRTKLMCSSCDHLPQEKNQEPEKLGYLVPGTSADYNLLSGSSSSRSPAVRKDHVVAGQVPLAYPQKSVSLGSLSSCSSPTAVSSLEKFYYKYKTENDQGLHCPKPVASADSWRTGARCKASRDSTIVSLPSLRSEEGVFDLTHPISEEDDKPLWLLDTTANPTENMKENTSAVPVNGQCLMIDNQNKDVVNAGPSQREACLGLSREMEDAKYQMAGGTAEDEGKDVERKTCKADTVDSGSQVNMEVENLRIKILDRCNILCINGSFKELIIQGQSGVRDEITLGRPSVGQGHINFGQGLPVSIVGENVHINIGDKATKLGPASADGACSTSKTCDERNPSQSKETESQFHNVKHVSHGSDLEPDCNRIENKSGHIENLPCSGVVSASLTKAPAALSEEVCEAETLTENLQTKDSIKQLPKENTYTMSEVLMPKTISAEARFQSEVQRSEEASLELPVSASVTCENSVDKGKLQPPMGKNSTEAQKCSSGKQQNGRSEDPEPVNGQILEEFSGNEPCNVGVNDGLGRKMQAEDSVSRSDLYAGRSSLEQGCLQECKDTEVYEGLRRSKVEDHIECRDLKQHQDTEGAADDQNLPQDSHQNSHPLVEAAGVESNEESADALLLSAKLADTKDSNSVIDECGLVDVYTLTRKIQHETGKLNKLFSKYKSRVLKIERLQNYLEQLKREKDEMTRLLQGVDKETAALRHEAAELRCTVTAVCDVSVASIGKETEAKKLEPACYRRYTNIRTPADASNALSSVRSRIKALNDLEVLIYRKQLVLLHVLPSAHQDKTPPTKHAILPMHKVPKSRKTEPTTGSLASGSNIVIEIVSEANSCHEEVTGTDSVGTISTPLSASNDETGSGGHGRGTRV